MGSRDNKDKFLVLRYCGVVSRISYKRCYNIENIKTFVALAMVTDRPRKNFQLILFSFVDNDQGHFIPKGLWRYLLNTNLRSDNSANACELKVNHLVD